MRNHKSGKGEPENCEGVQISTCIAVVFCSRFFIRRRRYTKIPCEQRNCSHRVCTRICRAEIHLCNIRWTSETNQNINPSQHYGEHECQTTEWTKKKTRIFTKQDVTCSKHRRTQLLLLLAITVHSAHAVHLASCIGASSYVCVWVCAMELHDAYVITTSYPSTIYLEHHRPLQLAWK